MAKLNTVTSSTRPASPAAGEAYFETDTNKIIIWDGSAWTELVSDYAPPSFANTYSLDFDGSDDYLDLGSTTYFDTSSPLSLSAWAKLDSTSGYPVLWSLKTSGSTGWKMGFTRDSSYAPMYIGSNSGFSNLKGGGSSLLTNIVSSFQHIVLTYNGNGTTTASNWKLYINGTEETLTAGGAVGATSTTTSYIGRDSTGNYLNGKVDEPAIFTSELSASDVTSIYNSGIPNNISALNPLAWWRMGDNDSGTGTTVTDQGSGGNDAVLYNSPTFSTDVPS